MGLNFFLKGFVAFHVSHHCAESDKHGPMKRREIFRLEGLEGDWKQALDRIAENRKHRENSPRTQNSDRRGILGLSIASAAHSDSPRKGLFAFSAFPCVPTSFWKAFDIRTQIVGSVGV
eukprot:CAMPEP_0171473464 /NCGR_PEP_ID=MMETSP0946-20130122/1854_1 /TAXON_ID=109269 /ORGANISM="Vaucheria litorea, Strain CCMP2940" /LENGTH=118 /DNA_ID=CAMNT_0012003227 /DNA_START=333 /DNA_END=689 /DNA_ORIENTATION=-